MYWLEFEERLKTNCTSAKKNEREKQAEHRDELIMDWEKQNNLRKHKSNMLTLSG